MYKRYQGNSGRVTLVEERHAAPGPPPPPPPHGGQGHRPAPPPPPRPPGGLGALLSTLELETEDLLLALIFYLLYRESGESEWLLVIGAMLFL